MAISASGLPVALASGALGAASASPEPRRGGGGFDGLPPGFVRVPEPAPDGGARPTLAAGGSRSRFLPLLAAYACGHGLPEAAAAFDGNFDVELADVIGQLKRLTHNHARHFTTKIIFQSTIVNADIAAALRNEYTRSSSLASTSAVKLFTCHISASVKS